MRSPFLFLTLLLTVLITSTVFGQSLTINNNTTCQFSAEIRAFDAVTTSCPGLHTRPINIPGGGSAYFNDVTMVNVMSGGPGWAMGGPASCSGTPCGGWFDGVIYNSGGGANVGGASGCASTSATQTCNNCCLGNATVTWSVTSGNVTVTIN